MAIPRPFALLIDGVVLFAQQQQRAADRRSAAPQPQPAQSQPPAGVAAAAANADAFRFKSSVELTQRLRTVV